MRLNSPRTTSLAFALLFLASTFAFPASEAATPVQAIGFGFPHNEVGAVNGDAGIQVSYCSMWIVGLVHSWDLTNLQTWINDCANATGGPAIPVIHWWYWAANVGKYCVNMTDPAHTDATNCANKSQQDWFIGAYSIANTTKAKIDAGVIDEAWVTIELEFNQNGTEQNDNFPTLLKQQSDVFQQKGIKTVAPFGSWTPPGSNWQQLFDHFATFTNDVDAVGSQILKGCSHHLQGEMLNATRDLRDWFWNFNNRTGGTKPLMVYDWGLSTYSGAGCLESGISFEAVQNYACDKLFNQGWIDSYRNLGVFAWIYRLRSDPGGSYPGYFGEAEKYFGFVNATTGLGKPAYQIVLNGIKAEGQRVAPPGSWTKVWEKEAESFATKSTGAAFNDGAASGGQAWNIWANGYISDSFSVSTTTAYAINVTARGDWAGGVAPQMKVTVDTTAVATVNVTSTTTWAGYVVQTNVTSGSHTLKIEFINDAIIGSEDRNLRVDKATIWQPTSEWLVQAESFATKTAGASFPDANAAAGAFWNLWSNGSINTTMRVETGGANVLRVAASGDSALSVWPEMKVYVNNTLVLDQFVNRSAWTTYRININYPQGDYPLKIQFVNDYYDPGTGADRNLKLDYAIVSPALASRWTMEVDAFTTKTAGGATPDTSASGLVYWNLWSNGYVSNAFTTTLSGMQDVRVVARADPAGGIYPHMKVYVDATTIFDGDVTGTGWQTYSISADFGAGTHTLKIEYTNDGMVGADDRNLNLDYATIYA